MKLSRIDQIALNGGDGAHYKYEEVAAEILDVVYDFSWSGIDISEVSSERTRIIKILVENFPDVP